MATVTKLKPDVPRALKIQKGVPVPSLRSGGPSPAKKGALRIALETMELSESVFVDQPPPSVQRLFYAMRLSERAAGRQPRYFVTRSVTEGGIEGVRIWRIA